MKKAILSAFILLIALGVSAKEVEQPTARQAANLFAASLSPLRSTQDVNLVYTAFAGSEHGLRSAAYPLFYIYNIGDQNGFVLIAGDDSAYPILGYADEGSFQADGMPANLTGWLAGYETEIAAQVATGSEASAEITQAWQELLAGSPQVGSLKAFIPTASWNQLTPYNQYTPMIAGKSTYTGCVATAMGIAMKYYEWPAKGTGSFNYLTETDSLSVSATLGTNYTWSNMLDQYVYTLGGEKQWTEVQGAAVAQLIFHCAAASYTDFTADWSGAYPTDAYYAFINHFGYDTGAYFANRELYSTDEWNVLLQSELDKNHLLFYNGYSEEDGAGHQFLIDGYNSSNYYHINWGWGGSVNGYFRLTSLIPDPLTPSSNYSSEQAALIGLQKPVEGSLPRYEFYYFDYPGSDYLGLRTDDSIIIPGKKFKLFISPFADYGMRDFNGYVSLCLADSVGQMKKTLDVLKLLELEAGYSLADLTGDEYTLNSADVSQGDVIQVMYSVDGKSWKKVRGIPGAVSELAVGVNLVANELIPGDAPVTILSASLESGISIRSNGQTSLRDIRLYDLSGRTVKHFDLSGETQVVLPATGLTVGVYLLKIDTEEGSSRFKIRLE